MRKVLLLVLVGVSACSKDVQQPLNVPPISALVYEGLPSDASRFRIKWNTGADSGTFTFNFGDADQPSGKGDRLWPSYFTYGGGYPSYHPKWQLCGSNGQGAPSPFYQCFYPGEVPTGGPANWFTCQFNIGYDSVGQGYVYAGPTGCEEYTIPWKQLRIKIVGQADRYFYTTESSATSGRLEMYDMATNAQGEQEARWLIWGSNYQYQPQIQHVFWTSQIVGDTIGIVQFGPLTKRPTNVVGSKNPAYVVANWTNQDATAKTEVWFGLSGQETYRATVLPTVSSYFVPRPGLPNGTYKFKLRHVKTNIATTPDFSVSNTVTLP